MLSLNQLSLNQVSFFRLGTLTLFLGICFFIADFQNRPSLFSNALASENQEDAKIDYLNKNILKKSILKETAPKSNRWSNSSSESAIAYPSGQTKNIGATALEILWPQQRQAFYTSEPIEIAVVGLPANSTAQLKLIPEKPTAEIVEWTVRGDGNTKTFTIPKYSLAPNVYQVNLSGKAMGKLTVSSGVYRSPLLLSQMGPQPPEGGANFFYGNAFEFGIYNNRGLPEIDIRTKKSRISGSLEKNIAQDFPEIHYMYWTGYVTHKPFGDEKSWGAESMHEAMRLLNFATAHRLRRFGPHLHALGPIDEPGLGWGRTPAGGMATGFPDWDEEQWYRQRGWDFTDDPGSRSREDWLKYLKIRCATIKDNYAQAKKDIHSVWPEIRWSGDLYAPLAILDGTDPLNQQVNDIPASHVFFDFFGGPLSINGQIYLEKAHNPLCKIAHAMNGQLVNTQNEDPKPLYHMLMNQMLTAGIHSNWWLNLSSKLKKEDIAAINEPAERLGPLFHEMNSTQQDMAILWSFTELGMRCKEVTKQEAKKKTGEQIKLLIPFPEKNEMKKGELETNGYEVGNTYVNQIIGTHQVLRRAGYSAHVLHERILPSGVLKRYKTLWIVGQTFDLPNEIQKSIDVFVANGGRVIVDPSTKIKIPGALVANIHLDANTIRQHHVRQKLDEEKATSKRAKSLVNTILYNNRMHELAVPATKEVLKQIKVKPIFKSDDLNIVAERMTAGEGELIMIQNAHQNIPAGPEGESVPMYNYVKADLSFSLPGIDPKSAVYLVEGVDWKSSRHLEKLTAPLQMPFAAGEMKLFLIAPRDPQGFTIQAKQQGHFLQVEASLNQVKMPWPFQLTITRSDGSKLYQVYRATNQEGTYRESFPIGVNLSSGPVILQLKSVVGSYQSEAKVVLNSNKVMPLSVDDPVRIFDQEKIESFLKSKPEIVIALAKSEFQPQANELQQLLTKKGLKVSIRPESEVIYKRKFPVVWDPYVNVYSADPSTEQKITEPIKQRLTMQLLADGTLEIKDDSGKSYNEWRQAGNLITIGAMGFLDWSGSHEIAYEKNCKLFIQKNNQIQVVQGRQNKVKTTAEFRQKWVRPWQQLVGHVGGFQFPPSLPYGYQSDHHLIIMGDSSNSLGASVIQASELLLQLVDKKYPGNGKALISMVWSPFQPDKNVIFIGASDPAGLTAGVKAMISQLK